MGRLLLFLLFIPFTLLAQSKAHFILLNQENGLSSSDVMCFEQDNNGFLWIGTKYGLNVYDGKLFNAYHLNNTAAPFNSDISSLKQVGTQMWIGTLGDGLFVFDLEKKTTQKINLVHQQLKAVNINSIDKFENKLWVGTNRGLYEMDSMLEVSYVPIPVPELKVTDVVVMENLLYVGSRNNGVIVLNQKFQIVQRLLHGEQVNQLAIFSNQLLVGTKSAGLIGIEKDKESYIINRYSEAFDVLPIINVILVDSDQHIWVGTDGDGLFQFQFDGQSLVLENNYQYNEKNHNSLASNAIFSLFQDAEKRLWIGTIWKGLNVLNQSDINVTFFYSDFYGISSYPVLSVFKTDDELWMGTDGKGLSIINLDTEQVSTYSPNNKLLKGGDYVQTIFKDSFNKYWLGTFSSGLISFDKKKGAKKRYKYDKEDKNSISYNDVRTILEDDSQNLWVATWGGGLNKFNRTTDAFERYPFLDGNEVSHLTDNITSMCFSIDEKGIWVGTFGYGLFYFDIESTQFARIESIELESLKILCTHLDGNNMLWMGTWGAGVKVFDLNRMEPSNYSGLDLISSARITAILEDSYQNLWMSTKDGILKFNKRENTLLKYGGFNLISNKEFHINSSFKDADGKMYFGGIEGVVAVTPSLELKTLALKAPVLTQLNLYNDNKRFELLNQTNKKQKIDLAYNQNYFTISFASPLFSSSDVYYSYKMEGLQNEWITTSGNSTTFTNISPGNYTFQVRASLNNFQWSEPTTIYLFIDQPYWKRWYAYLIYIVLFVVLLFFFQKYAREREVLLANLKIETLTREKEKELHNIKHRFFTNISHEIRTPVTLILGAVNRLIESGVVSKTNEKEANVMQNSSRHLLNLINELLDFRRLEVEGIQLKVAEGDFVKFVHEIYLSFQSQAGSNNIDYRFVSRIQETILWFDRDQMEKVIYNILSNAFKYTPAGGTITVEVDNDDQHGFFKIIDSGKGMDNSHVSEIFKRFYQSDNAAVIRKTGFGLGLSIAKDIVLLHGGEIGATNNTDKGISIAVKIPLGNSHFTAVQQLNSFKTSENIEGYLSNSEPLSGKVSLSEYSTSSLLIVEDNLQILDYIKGLFVDVENVYTAVNGVEGFEIASDKIPDLIISDVMMPIMDGVTMTKQLKTNIKTSHIPIVLLTARTNLIFKKEGFEVGADDYITKPFNETLLKTRVYNLLKNRKQLSERLLKEYISKPKEELSISTPDQKFLSDLTHVIERNIHENIINAKLISDELCMSHSVIYKKIKALTGLSMIEFIRDFKLNRAAILLSKYQMSVIDVCFKVGFSDRRYFSKLFKAKFEVTPSEYIKTGGVN